MICSIALYQLAIMIVNCRPICVEFNYYTNTSCYQNLATPDKHQIMSIGFRKSW